VYQARYESADQFTRTLAIEERLIDLRHLNAGGTPGWPCAGRCPVVPQSCSFVIAVNVARTATCPSA
jgi:hypothetical protein